MAYGLETRVPFLDNDLVDFAMRLPAKCKLARFETQPRLNENEPGKNTARLAEHTRDGKVLLRKAMEGILPSTILQRKKQGFSAPDESWFKGDSIAFVRRIILDPKSLLYEYFDYRAVVDLVSEHLEGRRNRRLLIWSLLSFDQWLKTFRPTI